ncbi:PEPxxWA-CTERM sorting domain-containing protein [Sphingomonas sp. RS2018]
MKIRLLTLAVGLFVSAPALAASTVNGGGCLDDLQLSGGSTVVSCYGRISGNSLNNANNAILGTALSALGYAGTTVSYSALADGSIVSLSGEANSAVNVPGVLNGTVFLGIHTGGGGKSGVGNQTSVYRINAVNLDVLTLRPSGGSTATLLAVTAPAVPEAATWAMMLIGFGGMGFALRRHSREVRIRFA